MKLWQKIAVCATAVTWLVLAVVFVVNFGVQTRDLQNIEAEGLTHAMELCRDALDASMEPKYHTLAEQTQNSLARYFFANYVTSTDNGEIAYALASDGKLLFCRTTYDPTKGAPKQKKDDATYSWRVKTDDGMALVVGGASHFRDDLMIYVSRSLTPLYQWMRRAWNMGLLTLGFAALLDAGLIFLIVRRAFRPVRRLIGISAAIAEGNYHLRTAIHTKDEIGDLSRSFDAMTDSVEEKIRSQEEELKKRQLLIGALSHEIKTPVTAITGYADSILRMPLTEAQKMECVRKIEEAGKKMASLSEQMSELLGLSDQNHLKRRHFSVQNLIDALQDVFPAGVEFHTEVQTLCGEESLLFQLCCNLIQNGLRACDGKSPVEVRFVKGKDCVLLVVEDQGCGISPEHLPLVTEPFYRVDPARAKAKGGSGLGLTICDSIVRWHGGRLHLESTPGAGTKVTAVLPEMTNG